MPFSVFEDQTRRASAKPILLAELLGMLSYALDMTEGQPPGHAMRSAWIGTSIGTVLGYTDKVQEDLLYTILLKDVGCSSNAARIAKLFLTDDIAFKRDHKHVDDSFRKKMQFVLNNTGPEAGLFDRFLAILNIASNTDQISTDLISTRCERGADIAKKLRFSPVVREGIRSLDEHWDGSGQPLGRIGSDIPRFANIALLAQVADVFMNTGGRAEAIEAVNSRAGTWFDPALVDAFSKASAIDDFWTVLESKEIDSNIFGMPAAQNTQLVDEYFLDDIAEAFALVVDAKSPFTADHSRRVAFYSELIAKQLGLSMAHTRWLVRAALLHDLGKLAVSNRILDKPCKLDDSEWMVVRSHPYHSERLLNKIDAFRDIATVAGSHHEKLDGTGYPNGLLGNEISLEARIITVADVFDALSAKRPYRDALGITEAMGIIEADIGTAFDGNCVRALRDGLKHIQRRAA